jgi:hypothetical protein
VDLLDSLEAASEALLAGATTADLDSDGYKEYGRQLDSSGRVLREQIDVDGDGRADLVWDYSGSTKTFRADTDGNGIAEISMDVTEDTADSAIHRFMNTRDSNGDGIPDLRQSYSVDPRQDIVDVLVEEDPDQDGSFPTQTTFTTTRIQGAPLASAAPRPLAACTASQQAALQSALKTAREKALDCMKGTDPVLFYRYEQNLLSTEYVISCGSLPDSCGHIDVKDTAPLPPGGAKKERPIFIDPNGFTSQCPSLEETIFHELSHYVLGLHELGDGVRDPQDQVFGCQSVCFGKATSQTCAQCIGQLNGDRRCDKFPLEPCGDVSTFCDCPFRQKFYPNQLACAVDCPTGLACFSARCIVRGPCRERD